MKWTDKQKKGASKAMKAAWKRRKLLKLNDRLESLDKQIDVHRKLMSKPLLKFKSLNKTKVNTFKNISRSTYPEWQGNYKGIVESISGDELQNIEDEIKRSRPNMIHGRLVGLTVPEIDSVKPLNGLTVELIYTDKYILGIEPNKTVHLISERKPNADKN